MRTVEYLFKFVNFEIIVYLTKYSQFTNIVTDLPARYIYSICADLNVSVWVARMLVSSTGQAVTTSPSLLLPSQPDTNTDYLASINQVDK